MVFQSGFAVVEHFTRVLAFPADISIVRSTVVLTSKLISKGVNYFCRSCHGVQKRNITQRERYSRGRCVIVVRNERRPRDRSALRRRIIVDGIYTPRL